MSTKENMTISELSEITEIPASTIRYYLREGLLSAPLKKGMTRAYYNETHITQLNRIRSLREETGLSIEEIKKDAGLLIISPHHDPSDDTGSQDRKNDIIEAAIELFRNKGYDSVSISDIAERAGISKATFYKHFSDKENLFSECADSVFFNIDRDFEELPGEKNVIKRLELRSSLFFNTHRHMIDMLQMMRGISSGADSRYREKLNKAIENLAAPIAEDLEEGIRQGIFRKMNTSVVAHLIMGAAEYGIYFCDGKSSEEIDNFIKRGVRFILRGFFSQPV